VIYGGTAYKILLLLHLLAVVIGFGPWMLNGLLPRMALRDPEGEGRAVNAAAFRVGWISQFAVYAVVIFGFGAMGAATKIHGKAQIEMSQTWAGVSLVLWVAIVGVMHGMAFPALKGLRSGEGDRAALTQRFSIASGIVNVGVIVVVALMIWTPGK